jgi:large subunit ribosomal protein L23
MAIFSKKTNTEEPKVKAVKAVKAKPVVKKAVPGKAVIPAPISVAAGISARALKNPRITEKATFNAEKNVYTFNVYTTATKHNIADAVFELYGVMPIKVNTVAIKAKRVLSRNKRGSKGGGKKAYVYLAKGDKIEFV